MLCYARPYACRVASKHTQYPLIHTYCTVRRNSKFQPFLLTSGLNRTPVYATALIKQCLIQKITAGSYWVELTWYKNLKNIFASLF